MKKKLALLMMVLLLISACVPSYNLEGKIGGSQQSFEEVYGPNQQEDETGLSAIYGYVSETEISAIFFEDHALFIASPLDDMVIAEALEYVEQFLPGDAVLVEEEGFRSGNSDQVYVYDSELLGETLESVGEEDSSGNKQRFSVRFEAAEESNYNAVKLQADGLEFNPD